MDFESFRKFTTEICERMIVFLKDFGSVAAPGFMRPEGIVIYHEAGGLYFKKTIENDEKGKEQ